MSSSGAASSGLVVFCSPMVEVRWSVGGAEQNDPAPWVGHTRVVSGSVSRRCRDRYWARASGSVFGAEQVGAGRRPDDERPAGEHSDRCDAVEEQVRQVFVGVAWRGEGPQGQAAQVDLVAVAEPDVVERPAAGGRGEDAGAVAGGELAGAGQEVGV